MIFKIQGYHGKVSKTMAQKLDATCQSIDPDFKWYYSGTLTEFQVMWQDKFLYYPMLNCEPKGPEQGLIFVTQYSSWSAR